MYRFRIRINIPRIIMFTMPVKNPAFAITNGIPNIPAPIVRPINVEIAPNMCFFGMVVFLVGDYLNLLEISQGISLGFLTL